MKLSDLLLLLVTVLPKIEGKFAVAGGFAASLYRAQPRLTNDIDIAIALGETAESKDAAQQLLSQIGAKTSLGWIPQLRDRNLDTMALVIGRFSENDYEATIDFLLPSLPWVSKAVQRAQFHHIDFGICKLPTITVEDIIISKTFALCIEPHRFQDLDDLKSIFGREHTFDLAYLRAEFDALSIALPKVLKPLVPKGISRLLA